MHLLLASSLPFISGLAVLVFVGELCVVTLFTLRIIFIGRGKRLLASTVGFFEITIWLFAISQVMRNLNDPGCFLGFAAGFTLGNYVGMLVEKWLALGTVVVRTITNKDAGELIQSLRAAHFGVTRIDAAGAKGPVTLIFTVIPRKELASAVAIVRRFDPSAFYSVDDIQEAKAGIFPAPKRVAGIIPSLLHSSRRAA